MLIRLATPDDIPAMIQLQEQASTAAHWGEREYLALFAPDAPQRIALVATGERPPAQTVGFIVARATVDEWEIENVVVDTGHRRQGIAQALIGLLLGRAAEAGIGSLSLEVRESNLPARQLYKKLGFTEEGRRPRYYRDPVEDACLLRRTVKDS